MFNYCYCVLIICKAAFVDSQDTSACVEEKCLKSS